MACGFYNLRWTGFALLRVPILFLSHGILHYRMKKKEYLAVAQATLWNKWSQPWKRKPSSRNADAGLIFAGLSVKSCAQRWAHSGVICRRYEPFLIKLKYKLCSNRTGTVPEWVLADYPIFTVQSRQVSKTSYKSTVESLLGCRSGYLDLRSLGIVKIGLCRIFCLSAMKERKNERKMPHNNLCCLFF